MKLSEEFLERQLFFLQRAGLGRAQAEARLLQEVPEGAAAIGSAGRSDPFLQFLAEFREELGVHLDAVEQAAREFRSEATNAFQPLWRSLLGTGVYAGAITAIAALLIGLSTTFIVIYQVYGSFGAELPRFTQLVIVPLYRNPLIVTMAAGVLLLFWTLRNLYKITHLSLRRPGSVFMRLAAGLGLRDYWLVLVLALARGACRSGMPAGAALEAAQRIVERWTGLARLTSASVAALREPLLTAGRLGTLDAELAFLIEERWRLMPQRAASRAEYVSLLVNILVAAAIGALVIALYLPILKLAAVVG